MKDKVEIERKFAVLYLPKGYEQARSYNINQGYLKIEEDYESRLRKINNVYLHNQKNNGDLIRPETKHKVSRIDYEEGLNYIQSNLIEKIRYKIPNEDGTTSELDIYDSHLLGLVVVEVEFKTLEASQNFVLPPWFGIELTKDKRFKNMNLSRYKKETFLPIIEELRAIGMFVYTEEMKVVRANDKCKRLARL